MLVYIIYYNISLNKLVTAFGSCHHTL